MTDDELSPGERERIRRQDQEAGAKDRGPMRPGMGKVFKQILDAQARTAREMTRAGEEATRDEPAGDRAVTRKPRTVRRR
jgi:hypothetical protein